MLQLTAQVSAGFRHRTGVPRHPPSGRAMFRNVSGHALGIAAVIAACKGLRDLGRLLRRSCPCHTASLFFPHPGPAHPVAWAQRPDSRFSRCCGGRSGAFLDMMQVSAAVRSLHACDTPVRRTPTYWECLICWVPSSQSILLLNPRPYFLSPTRGFCSPAMCTGR